MSLKEALGKVWDEFERPMKQGTAEMANAMFNGTAFVPYGEGQRSAPQKEDPQPAVEKQVEIEREM